MIVSPLGMGNQNGPTQYDAQTRTDSSPFLPPDLRFWFNYLSCNWCRHWGTIDGKVVDIPQEDMTPDASLT